MTTNTGIGRTTREATSDATVDVAVVGGGAAGVAAAVGAARAGARTALVEKGPCLGGAATLRNVVTFCGLYNCLNADQVVHGVADEVLAGLRARDAVSGPERFTGVAAVFDPESLKTVLDEVTDRAGVVVRTQSLLIDADAEDDGPVTLTIADHAGLHRVRATTVVDTSGEADLGARLGAQVVYGHHGGRIQMGTLGVRVGGVGAHVAVDKDALGRAVDDAWRDGVPDLGSAHGLVARMPVSGDLITYLVDEAYDATNARQTQIASVHARRSAARYLEVLRTLPGFEHAYVVTTGPELGTRESRHVLTREPLAADQVTHPAPRPDAVAFGAWPMEYHPTSGDTSQWQFVGDPGWYGIPLPALHSASHDALWVAGRTMDGDAHASHRVMGTAFGTGQAAGVAAALAASVGQASAEAVRATLDEQDAVLPPHPPATAGSR